MHILDNHPEQKIRLPVSGQRPSDFPDFAQFLVAEGIDSISVTPDSFVKTVRAIHRVETAAMVTEKV
jgi:pyruvate,water dikinase